MNVSQELHSLDGKPLMFNDSVLSLGSAIAYCLLGRKTDAHKAYLLATKLYQATEVELDNADLSFIKDTVKSTEAFQPIVTGQILELLNTSK